MQLKELAQLCGVSQSTVSRVLNGYNGSFSVKQEVRDRILQTAEEVGYKPNPVYRALRSKQNNLIMTLFPSTDNHYSGGPSMEAIGCMSTVFFEHGYGFSSFYSPAKSETRDKSYYQMPFIKAGGYVLPDVSMPSQYNHLKDIKSPMLVINGLAEGPLWDTVNSDEIENMRIVMDYLVQNGHKRIAYINTYPDDPPHYSITDREKGYRVYCEKHRLPLLDGAEIRTRDFNVHIDRLLATQATAVVVYNHYLASRLVHTAWKRGVRIPQNLSVITFNNDTLLESMIPPLTCLNPASETIGRRAAEIMMGRISGSSELPDGPIFEKYAGTIIERESVAHL